MFRALGAANKLMPFLRTSQINGDDSLLRRLGRLCQLLQLGHHFLGRSAIQHHLLFPSKLCAHTVSLFALLAHRIWQKVVLLRLVPRESKLGAWGWTF